MDISPGSRSQAFFLIKAKPAACNLRVEIKKRKGITIDDKRIVILSTPLLLEEGTFRMRKVSLEEAKELAKKAENFVGHSTVRILGVEPATDRKVCDGYDVAITVKVRGRLDFGREYTAEEIESIGYDIFVVEKGQ